ncbi:MAG: sulfotransferase [Chlorobi bacterium]|nr:sulfotransferase [Chlorobiota bacterium]
MSEFKLPPVSTLMGSTLLNYIRVLKQGKVTVKYRKKVFLTTLVVIATTPFHWWEWLYFKVKLIHARFRKPPLFILGHWRSGTTLLHNMLCEDPDASFLTTYQSVFPNNLASKIIFKTFMKAYTPESRPTDNIKLHVDFPQEDEFAFSNMYHHSYYNFFYFPRNYSDFYDNSVHFKNLDDKEKRTWFRMYDKMLKKAYLNTKGDRLVVKNPVNTARIKTLLKLYPDAKFLYIYRNPVSVILSTQKFLKSLMPTLYLQEVDNQFIEDMIYDIYKRLNDDYIEQKSLIPDKNLIELRYEDFEKEPVEELKNIYENLLEEDFENVKKYFTKYFESVKGYKKNRYEVNAELINKIKQELNKYMELYQYNVPDDIIIKN